ncbi:MAG TPA: hypothetical protein VM889_08800 [Candidatus Thermoplasmatota archaeon]|nr:hypothetical protein [Candidatus Thermoplasmatota archaeon]
MLDQAFRDDLERGFQDVFHAVRDDAVRDARRLLDLAGGDRRRAVLLSRAWAASRLWWPYVRATGLFGRRTRPAQEAVVHVVLVVDHLHGHEPSEEEARAQVTRVLDSAFDVGDLKDNLRRDTVEGAKFAWAAPLLAPLLDPRRAWRLVTRTPFWFKLAVAGLIAAIAASIPVATGVSIAVGADREAVRALRARVIDIQPVKRGEPSR